MSTSETNQPSLRNGFDVILGNPPWERVKLQEQEFFAQRDPAIAAAANAAARKKAIVALKDSLDDILCDPSLAVRFDECAGRIKPGVPPLHWRWAALAFRKTGRRRSLGTTAAFELRDAARQPLLFDAVPPVAGLYMLTANDRPIYVNETRDLHETMIRHAEVGGGELVPPWLLDQFPAADGVRWAALAGVNPDTLHEGRIRLVANERPWLNLVDALGAA